jgi:hypothetical protein
MSKVNPPQKVQSTERGRGKRSNFKQFLRTVVNNSSPLMKTLLLSPTAQNIQKLGDNIAIVLKKNRLDLKSLDVYREQKLIREGGYASGNINEMFRSIGNLAHLNAVPAQIGLVRDRSTNEGLKAKYPAILTTRVAGDKLVAALLVNAHRKFFEIWTCRDAFHLQNKLADLFEMLLALQKCDDNTLTRSRNYIQEFIPKGR